MIYKDFDNLPDVRDGLTRRERIVLYCVAQARKETKREFVPTAMLYGRVVEYISITEAELISILQKLGCGNTGVRVKNSEPGAR